MREMLKSPMTWLLIIMLLSVAFIGGLQDKKTVAENPTTNYITE